MKKEKALEKIRQFYEPLMKDTAMIEAFANATTVRKYKKGEYILRRGEIKNMAYFIQKGIVGGIILNREGQEIVECIAFESSSPGLSSYNKIEMDVPSPEDLIALTDTILFCVKMEDVIEFASTMIPVSKYIMEQLGISMQRYQELRAVLNSCPAEEKYRWFLEKYPGVIDQIKHTYIASFLAMNPSTLSRVRERIKNNDI